MTPQAPLSAVAPAQAALRARFRHPSRFARVRSSESDPSSSTNKRQSAPIRAVAGARRALPEGHRHTGLFLQLQEQTLMSLTRHDQAEPVLLEAHRIAAAFNAVDGWLPGLMSGRNATEARESDANPAPRYDASRTPHETPERARNRVLSPKKTVCPPVSAGKNVRRASCHRRGRARRTSGDRGGWSGRLPPVVTDTDAGRGRPGQTHPERTGCRPRRDSRRR